MLLMIKAASDGSTSVRELATRLQLAHNGIAERVGRLERAGLITRDIAEHDRRMTIIRLTRLGDRRLTKAFWELGSEAEALAGVTADAEGWSARPADEHRGRPDS